MMVRRGLAVVAIVVSPPAAADEPARTNLRYDEDWSGQETGAKNLPLDAAGHVRLTLGLEARARQESYANPLWGDAPDDGYLWLRFMPLADLRAGPVRAFVQPIIGYARGVSGGNGPADQTGIDLLQGFADLNLKLGSDAQVTLRGGRELVALGSERLVGTRYGPNIPQAFDGGRMIATAGPIRIDVLNLRAVEVGQGDFDDHGSGRRRLRAIYATAVPTRGLGLDFYWIGYRDRQARFGGRAGPERRETYGLRLFGVRNRLAWNWEAMVQRGDFDGLPIRAWSLATETTISFPEARFRPRLRLRANYASGDGRSDDHVLGTFNALFPKGRYFGELTPIGPRNIVNLNPGVSFDIGQAVTVELSAAAFWRASSGDGIYDVPGKQIAPAGSSAEKHIGSQIELGATWQAAPALSLSGSLARFGAGRYLRETGRNAAIYMSGLEAAYKF
ncbi:alginate export family protein [Novosphingobium jiangmenense]|nr:alginate export family protein [Novosphingobium jiangmenense]